MSEVDPMQLPELGELFEGRYELIQLLGEGGFARVYLAREPLIGREVALKVLSPTGGKYRDVTAARFLREVRLIASLQDPHTVTLYDFGQTESGLLYMACEYIRGGDLQQLLMAERRLEPRVVVHILSQVLASLREAHSRGITHRDIKPANILIHEYEGDPYRAKVVDFGLAKPNNVDATQLTREGVSAGTPRYMSPEQILAQGVGPPSDIYSLGLVASEMLTGEPAVNADNRRALLRKHLDGPQIVVPEHAAPLVLREVIDRMTVRQPADRYSTVEEVLADLRRLPNHFVGPKSVNEDAETRPHKPLQARIEENERPAASRTIALVGFVTLAVAVFIVVALLLPEPTVEEQEVTLPPSVRTVAVAQPEDLRPSLDSGIVDVGAKPTDMAVAVPEVPEVPGGTAGCGLQWAEAQRTITFSSGGVEFVAEVRVPKTYQPSRKHPMLLTFRGRQLRPYYKPDDVRDFWKQSGLRKPASENGYILVGVELLDPDNPYTFRIDRDWAEALLRNVHAAACFDPARIDVLGHDRGAVAAHTFICARPVSAAAIWHDLQVADDERCTPDPQIPVLKLYGHKDRDVGAGKRRSNCDPTSEFYVGHKEATRQWRERNRCRDKGSPWKTETAQVDGVCSKFACKGAPYVECELVAGRQLPFPKGLKFRVCQRDVPRFDLAGVTLEFFATFARPMKSPDRE